MLRVLNLKLANISMGNTNTKGVTELLMTFTQPYFQRAAELATRVRDIIDRVTESAISRIRCSGRSTADPQNWGEVLLHFPQIYLQTVASLDKALSWGHYCEEEEPQCPAPSEPIPSPLSASDAWSWMGCVSSHGEHMEIPRSGNFPSPISATDDVPHAMVSERESMAQVPMRSLRGADFEAAMFTAVDGSYENLSEDSWAGSLFDLFLAEDALL
jgi:hypothetical protein